MISTKKQLGVATIEYALVIALVAVVAMTSLTSVGTAVSDKFAAIATALAP